MVKCLQEDTDELVAVKVIKNHPAYYHQARAVQLPSAFSLPRAVEHERCCRDGWLHTDGGKATRHAGVRKTVPYALLPHTSRRGPCTTAPLLVP